MRDALAYVPKGQHTMVAAAIRQAFIQPDHDNAALTWRHVADQLRVRWPRLGSFMDDAETDVLAYMAFPAQHQGLIKMVRDASVIAGFPPEFRQGMAARSAYLGDVGNASPDNWDLPHGGNGFDVGLLVMAGSVELKEEKLAIGHAAVEGLDGV